MGQWMGLQQLGSAAGDQTTERVLPPFLLPLHVLPGARPCIALYRVCCMCSAAYAAAWATGLAVVSPSRQCPFAPPLKPARPTRPCTAHSLYTVPMGLIPSAWCPLPQCLACACTSSCPTPADSLSSAASCPCSCSCCCSCGRFWQQGCQGEGQGQALILFDHVPGACTACTMPALHVSS